jgi:single-strand selective monofunctional uracil DNA glycosylase
MAAAAERHIRRTRGPVVREPEMSSEKALLEAADRLSKQLQALAFSPPVSHVYNPLVYARAPYALYLERYAKTKKRVLFLGMNPGPFGMAQTGVPFGEVSLVRDWLGIQAKVERPRSEHPKRKVEGFDCPRSEVSGARLWGLWKERFVDPQRFFSWAFIENYCPLVFMSDSGANITPDKLNAAERTALFRPCDERLRAVVRALAPESVVGIGKFAERRAREALAGSNVRIASLLHPSPASPAANRGWAELAVRELTAQGITLG